MANSMGYFTYLIDIVKAYSKVPLCEELYLIPFRYDPLIEHDGISAENCKKLRLSYQEFTGERSDKDGECCVLEFLVYISIKMEDIMGLPGDYHPETWFNEMIDNLDIDMESRERIREKVNKWMDRDFKKNGSGGLFPLKHAREDQRKVPFWDQAGSYMGERV